MCIRDRLWQVIVRPNFQPQNLINFIAAGSQYNDWNGTARPQLFAYFEAIHSRQHDVEYDKIWVRAIKNIQSIRSILRDRNIITFSAQAVCQRFNDYRLI